MEKVTAQKEKEAKIRVKKQDLVPFVKTTAQTMAYSFVTGFCLAAGSSVYSRLFTKRRQPGKVIPLFDNKAS